MKLYEEIIHILQSKECHVATMESCTGGSVASEITNHNGLSIVSTSLVKVLDDFVQFHHLLGCVFL